MVLANGFELSGKHKVLLFVCLFCLPPFPHVVLTKSVDSVLQGGRIRGRASFGPPDALVDGNVSEDGRLLVVKNR